MQAIIFDMDDTLYPERNFVFSGFLAVSVWAEAHLGIMAEDAFAELWKYFVDGVRGNTFDLWLEGRGFRPETYRDDLVKIYRTHKPSLTPFREVPPLLESLKGRFKLALLADGYLDVQRRKLRALAIAHYLEVVVFSDAFGRGSWKPSTRPFECVLSELGIAPDVAVYVGDNPLKDFYGAKQLGMFTIQLNTPTGEYCHLTPPSVQHAADKVCNSFSDLRKLLIDKGT